MKSAQVQGAEQYRNWNVQLYLRISKLLQQRSRWVVFVQTLYKKISFEECLSFGIAEAMMLKK
ncbi:MAG: hypothetical protein D8M57_19245 [Candidatus Scalindua sp. AMX11]|nr:MAG: hypothetical protein DWQ00_03065 [Candidatus Scalindua sp.]TDE63267.1 MAG: hypothetical protein D8M57_19245 [Candidatus Scalindua sp. AMX11]